MKTLLKLLFAAAVLGLFSACASMSPHMTIVQDQAELKPDSGKALVVFVRPSKYGGAVQATIYDGTQYIGTVSAKTKVAYQAEPGEHMFMVVGESADFMKADLAEGKTYYAKVQARMGVWKARFSLVPENGQTPEKKLQVWLSKSKLTAPNDMGTKWAMENQASIQEKHDKYLPAWNEKADTSKQILKKESGR